MNWKDFKTWLDKNIIQTDGLQVKIKPEFRNKYSKLSTIALTDFCDSLEATLDKNKSYHLLPIFQVNKSFQKLFPCETTYFGKKTNQQKLSEIDYNLLK
ncbi:hypothetical protein [endosymbiont GvMRE of Glomus versiforme]|uniref:hypothetical protein n=1 Tax=endosymbiont GvMRE of Glomus versiforme TaxID=2039283 RepID=UPI000ED6F82E|nr:hypothetical protein [endosymbiont GvMRE of Glomus versiforme]RHZ36793.1 hypothetical protein GvMRE_I2g591 [endosymbiont GvMRE of Glomus versiforme]